MTRTRKALLGVLMAVGAVVPLLPTPADAAATTVGDGLTTTDLGTPGMTPGALASALVGPGISISNATFSGANAQAGLVHLVDPAVVSFNDGVILSSGNIADVVGPNKSDGITGDMVGPSDPDLDALIQNTQTVNPVTFDAASLEFDFVATASPIYFTYTFGSDEYLEWVNLFNDVFAFYVNGQNCATVPNGDPVSIDTINSDVNPNLFRDNSFSSPPANPINIESDGLSVEMICTAAVTVGQTNHMKLAIADTSDQILDSVVMIKSDSLSTTPPESCNDQVDNDDDTYVDLEDPSCTSTTTPPPTGSGGIGSDGSPPPFTGNEGTPIPLDASALGWVPSNDTLNTTWTVEGINGTTGTCDVAPSTPQPLTATGDAAVVTATCPNEGEYVAHVFGWDVEQKGSWDTDVDFFVHNAPPTVAIATPSMNADVVVGSPVDLSAPVADPGLFDSITCSIDWGDGLTTTGAANGGLCEGTHVYSAVGPAIVSVLATDDAGDSAAAAIVLNVVDPVVDVAPEIVTQPASVTVLAHQDATFTATASGAPTPTVQWQRSTDGGTTWVDIPGAAGATYVMTADLAASGDQLRAVFTNVAGVATTDRATLTVVQNAVTLDASNGAPVSGEPVYLHAVVADADLDPAAITGRVTFYDGATVIGRKRVSAGTATLRTTKLALGPHPITAVFQRTLVSPAVSSSVIDVTVGKPSTTVALTAVPVTTTALKSVTLRAKVTVVAPGRGRVAPGSVTFFDGETPIATVTITTGSTVKLVTTFAAGPHDLTAVYSGSATLSSSPTSNLVTVSIA